VGDRLKYEFRHLGDTTSAGYDPTYYVQEGISKPDSLVMTFEITTEDVIERGATEDIEVFGSTAVYVRDWLVSHINGPINSILVRITDTLCDKTRGEWLIKTDSLNWCDSGECKYQITLTQYEPADTCIKQYLIDDNHRGWFPDGGFVVGTDPITGLPNEQFMHPRYRYCDDIKPQALQNLMFVIAQTILIGFNSLVGPIVWIFQVLDDVLDKLGMGGLPGMSQLEDMYKSFEDKVFGAVLGCNRVHPAPFVRNYFENICSKCGITFESSIFKNPGSLYYNLSHLFAPIKKGLLYDSTKDWIKDNRPAFDLVGYADELKPVFNAKYRLDNGNVFRFERRDYFEIAPIFDFTGADRKFMISDLCYTWNGKEKFANQYFRYEPDTFDVSGNEAGHRFNGVKYWNTNNNPLLKGVEDISAAGWSPQRYTNDGIDKRVIFKALANQTNAQLDGVLLMAQDITGMGKLIIWDGVSDKENARVDKIDYDTYRYGAFPEGWPDDQANISGTDYYVFNKAMMYNPEANAVYPNLYHFRTIDDPNKFSRQAKQWNVTLQLCCEVVNKILIFDPLIDAISAKVDYLVQISPTEEGVITRIEIDYQTMQVRFTGRIR